MANPLYLAPTGDDAGDGSPSRPLATWRRALEAAQQDGVRRIVVRGGDYFDTAAVLTPMHSGLTVEAAPGESPVFYGGRRVTGWQRIEHGWYAAALPGVREGTWDFRALVVNGRFASRARYPETGVLPHLSVFDVQWMSSTKGGWERPPTPEELTTLHVSPGIIPGTLEPANAELTLYHCWDVSLVGVAALDLSAGVLRFTTPAGHPPGAFAMWKDQALTFVIWNTREGMTRPGQWFLDRAGGRLVYWPLPGEQMEDAVVIAPTTPVVLRVDGTEAAPVRDLTLQGLTFAVTTTPLVAGGFGAQAFAGALHGQHLVDGQITGLHVRWACGQGIKLARARNLACRGCEITETGAGGLSITGEGGEITNTLIHHVGRIYPSALALHCHGRDWRVAHNELHHTPYSAVNAGGSGLLIEKNRFHHVMEELVDGAAIYLFAAKGCTIRHNVTTDVRDEQVHAYYLDEQSENSVVEGNLAVGVPWPLHMHMAWDCTLRDNVCVNPDGPLTVSLQNCDGFRLEWNVFAARDALTLKASYSGIAALIDNLVWSAAGAIRWDLHDRLPSLERHTAPVPLLPVHERTLIADPGWEDGAFRAESPVHALGLREPPVVDAGRR